jgi:DNA-binding PadR family transcriptional regulator
MKNPAQLDLPRGTLDLLILRGGASGPIHGYAIAQRIQQMSQEALQFSRDRSTPRLRCLEHKKFLAADWRLSETGREAKSYRLTARGRHLVETETASWARPTVVVGLILQGPQGEAS